MENKMQDSGRNRKDFLMDMVKRVYSDDMNLIDLDRELVDKLDDFITSEISKAREEGTEELRQAFYDTFYKSGELWFDYLFEDGDTKAEQNAKEVVEEYWKEIISKLNKKK